MKKLSDLAPHGQNTRNDSNRKPKSNPNKSAEREKAPAIKNRGAHHKVRFVLLITTVVLALLAAAVALIMAIAAGNTRLETGKVSAPIEQPAPPTKYYSPLTGSEVADADATKRPVLAVMIENSPEARPQSGLFESGVIFEAVAEGGITRFVALHQESTPSLIGPVRSLRPYYLEWAAAFSPAVAHVGGSSDALNMIRSGNYGVDLDQSANGSSFWRAKDRRAPHNVYTDHEHLSNLAKSKGKSSSDFTGFTRADIDAEPSKGSEVANTIKMAVSTGKFAVSYQYDSASQTYKRFQGGAAHQDREKGQIAPKVVIALRVTQTLKADRVHNSIGTIGEGDCFVFQNGTAIKGRWQKTNAQSQMKFLDESGAEIRLARGQTWITAVGQGRNISWQ